MNTQIRRRPILTINGPRQTPKSELSVAIGTAPKPPVAEVLAAANIPAPSACEPPGLEMSATKRSPGLEPGVPAPKPPTRNPELDAAFADLRELRKRFKGMRRPLPLKIGIAADLIAETGWPKDRIGKALGIHVRATGYLKATVEGAPRVDLNGTAVGTVAADQAAYARATLKAREKQRGQA